MLPYGFPLDPSQLTDVVVGASGQRRNVTAGGPAVREVSERLHVSGDAAAANSSGWNCRVHVEYEGSPAVDWYVPAGSPVYATLDGTATLYVNTVANAFDYYGVDREPYIGEPDRARAPVTPVPGPGGGMGVWVSIAGGEYRTDYGHLDVRSTTAALDGSAFIAPFTAATDYAGEFSTPQATGSAAVVARWPVRRGDVIGFTGDAGYSEAPHLHYVVARVGSGEKLCPTREPGFSDGGWLFGPD
jgi:murein DD-endopeptidase MepM/ murein hydrolase activator NlpD